MIQANELRIGSLLNYGNDIVVVSAIFKSHFNCERLNGVSIGNNHQNNFQSIHLTREILEKCGFVTDGFYNSAERWVLLDILLFRGNGHFILCYYPKTEIKYLHQLQNLYFALTGKELIYTP